jgi:hypothetical protein
LFAAEKISFPDSIEIERNMLSAFEKEEPSIDRTLFGITIIINEEQKAKTLDSIRMSTELASNVTDVSKSHPEKQSEQRTSIF